MAPSTRVESIYTFVYNPPCIYIINVALATEPSLTLCCYPPSQGPGACQENAQVVDHILSTTSTRYNSNFKLMWTSLHRICEGGLKGRPVPIVQNVELRSSKQNLSDWRAGQLAKNEQALLLHTLEPLLHQQWSPKCTCIIVTQQHICSSLQQKQTNVPPWKNKV